MSIVVQMVRRLTERPSSMEIDGFRLRNYRGEQDIGHWLRIRHAAFAREKLGVRRWEESDFRRELLAQPWWTPERMWFVSPDDETAAQREPIGTVTCALRGSGASAKPVVHWLAVLPRWRRHGVARLLMSALEADCWAAGHRAIYLETHQSWTSAARFYEALGYRVATPK